MAARESTCTRQGTVVDLLCDSHGVFVEQCVGVDG
jgi:hypothetical protein